MTDPEDTVSVSPDQLREQEVDLRDPFADDLPIEADEGDVADQRLDVPDSDEDDYPA